MENIKLPEGWKVDKLGNLVDIKTGKLDANNGDDGGNYPFFTCASEPIKINSYSFDEEAIILAGNGANVGLVLYYNGKFEAYQRTYVITNFRGELKYLYYYMKMYWKRYNDNKQYGSATNYIKMGNFTEFEVILPPLVVQKKIVEVLERAENILEKRKESNKLLDELVKSQFIEMFGYPVSNKKGLPKLKLSEIGDWKTGGTPSRSNNEYYNGMIPWLSSGELNNMYCSDSIEKITETAIKESSAKIIPIGSLLLGMYDTAALKSTINMIECSCNQAIAYANLNENLVNTVYVYYCIQIGKEFYKSQQRGVRQKNLNLSMVKGLEILSPDLSVQNQFADFVKQADKLKFEMQKSLEEMENNFDSLMQKAFKGELFN